MCILKNKCLNSNCFEYRNIYIYINLIKSSFKSVYLKKAGSNHPSRKNPLYCLEKHHFSLFKNVGSELAKSIFRFLLNCSMHHWVEKKERGNEIGSFDFNFYSHNFILRIIFLAIIFLKYFEIK